jgi:hypothetical protein
MKYDIKLPFLSKSCITSLGIIPFHSHISLLTISDIWAFGKPLLLVNLFISCLSSLMAYSCITYL